MYMTLLGVNALEVCLTSLDDIHNKFYGLNNFCKNLRRGAFS